eukprot:s843_g5.t2
MGSIGPLGACTDYYVWLVAILCLLTTQVRSLSNANVFTQISLVCILGMIICMLVAVFEYDIEEKDLSMMVVRLASGCTISSWAYVPAFLTVELSACMETPAEFKKSLLFSGGLNVLVFIIVGSIVVARWGFEVGEVISITAGVGAWVPGTDVNTIFSCFKLGGNFVSYMLDSVPLCRFCQRSWAPSFKDTWSASDVMRYLGYTLPTFILALVLATFTPSIGTLLDFVTALTTPWVTQIYPALLYWKFLRDRDSDGESGKSSQASRSMVLEKAAVLFVLFVGYVSFVMCSVKAVGYLAIEDLRPKFQIGCSGWVLWESSANKVNEVADLVDKLGRAVLQRDENIREKSKAQVRLTKVEADLRALSEECGRLKRQNKSLGDQLKEANRRAECSEFYIDTSPSRYAVIICPQRFPESLRFSAMARSSRLRQIFCCLALGLLALLPRAFVLGVPVQGIERRLAPASVTKRSRTPRKAVDPAVVLDGPVLAASVTAAGLAAFAAFQAFQGQRRATLKQELLAAVEASQRGVDEAQNDRIGGLFAELEALNPTAEPLTSSQLKGDWELLWTTSSAILGLGRPPFFRPVEDRPILQYLDPARGVARNLEFTPLGPNRVLQAFVSRLDDFLLFKQGATESPGGTYLPEVEGLEKTTVGVRFKVFTLFGLLPIQAPDSATGILQVTYLDENLRLSRGDRGNLFVLRKAKFVPPRPDADAPDDSDEEFEHELLAFEQRFIILEEGPAGLDILASNLSKDKLNLEKRLKSSNENVDSLTASVGEWRRLSEEKDLEISDLSTKLDQMMREHAALEEAIAQKRREIEQQVAEEKAALEAKVQELQLECDNARAISDGMDKASNREAEKKRTAEEASATGALGGVASTDEKEVSEAFGNSTTSASGQPPESRFYELINHEMQKVNRHFSLQLRSIVDRLAFAGNSALSSGVHGALGDDQDNLKEAQAALFQHVKAGGGGDNLPVAAKFLQTAADVLVELDNYRSLNKTAFRQEGSPATRGRTLVKNFDLVFPAQQGHLASTPESMSGEGLTSELQKLIRAMGMGIMQSRLYSKTSLLRLALGGLPDVPEAAGKGNGEGSDLVELDRSSAALDVHAFTPVQQLGSPEAFLMEGRPDESSR